MARRPTTTSAVDEECARWKLQIELAERDSSSWEKKCEEIIKRYRDDRADDNYAQPRRYNVLWSNVQTLLPSTYGREPVPIAERRFLDKDVVGRVASQMLERAMRYEMMDCGFHDTVKRCVKDWLLVGRGVAWLRYKPAFGPASSLTDRGDDELQEQNGDPVDEGDPSRTAERDEQDESNERTNETPAEKLIGATTDVDYVNWRDFLHSKARTWKEVEWIARRIYMSRQDLVDNFGRETGEDVPLDHEPDNTKYTQVKSNALKDGLKKATVYEIWCKYERKVYFVAKGYNKLLEEPREDPLNLEGFWPCPEPLFATMTNDTLQPVPDFQEYKDQAYELDKLTQRIDALLSALKVTGTYNSAIRELERMLDEGSDNKLYPVPNWAAFAEKGGITGSISFMPIKEIADVLQALFEARERILQDLYQITGLSDIIRGQADPRETAEAIKTKGRFGSLRLQDRQGEVARFCRDIIRMMGEIISEHYPDETLITISGIMYEEGIGSPMPTKPKAPTQQEIMASQQQAQAQQQAQQAPPSPMMGHNGGPPMAPPQPTRRPVPGGPPMRAPDGHMYVHAPHPGGLYQRVAA